MVPHHKMFTVLSVMKISLFKIQHVEAGHGNIFLV
jgi:hypothetical protein